MISESVAVGGDDALGTVSISRSDDTESSTVATLTVVMECASDGCDDDGRGDIVLEFVSLG